MSRYTLVMVLGVAVVALGAGSSSAVVFYTSASATYAENFDGLAATGSGLPWANDSTVPGWYVYDTSDNGKISPGRDSGPWSAVTSYGASDGSLSTGFYSFGGSATYPSVNPDSDRALGSVPGGSPIGDVVQALVFQNKTGETLTQFTLSYAGEQWRAGAGGGTRWQDFDYKVSATFDPDADLPGNVIDGYNLTGVDTANPFLDFSGSGYATGAYDGNNASYRQLKSETVTGFSWAPDEYLILRWWHDNAPGSDHGLAIDDLSFVAPEPTAAALLVAGVFLVLPRRRRL